MIVKDINHYKSDDKMLRHLKMELDGQREISNTGVLLE